jgi:hypothetical protein
LSAATNIRAAQSAAVFQIAVAQTDSFNTIKSATTLAAIVSAHSLSRLLLQWCKLMLGDYVFQDLLAAPFLAAIDTMDTAFGTQRQTAATAAMMQACESKFNGLFQNHIVHTKSPNRDGKLIVEYSF